MYEPPGPAMRDSYDMARPEMLKLITSPPSPFGRKVAVALREKGLEYSVEFDRPWDEDAKAPSINPLGQVPVLITADGSAVYDSSFILEWLETTFPDRPLLPIDPLARLQAKKRQMLAERLMLVAQALVLETYRPDPSKAWMERQSRKLTAGLSALDDEYRVRAGQALSPPDLGDIASGTTLLMFEFMVAEGLSPPLEQLKWRGSARSLTRLVEKLEGRSSFVETAPGSMSVNLTATVG